MAETFCFFLALFVLLLWQSVFYCTSICHTHFSHSFHSRSSSASIVSLGFATKYASASEQWLPMPADTPGQAGGTEERETSLVPWQLAQQQQLDVERERGGEGWRVSGWWGCWGCGGVSMWLDSLRGDCLMCQKWQQEAEEATIKHTKPRQGEWRRGRSNKRMKTRGRQRGVAEGRREWAELLSPHFSTHFNAKIEFWHRLGVWSNVKQVVPLLLLLLLRNPLPPSPIPHPLLLLLSLLPSLWSRQVSHLVPLALTAPVSSGINVVSSGDDVVITWAAQGFTVAIAAQVAWQQPYSFPFTSPSASLRVGRVSCWQ